LALRGIALAARQDLGASHLLLSSIEHPAVSRTAADLAAHYGFACEALPVDSTGLVNPEDVRKRIRKDTALVSVIHASNEIGTIQPIKEIGEICRSQGLPFHTDSVQAALQMEIRVDAWNVDSMSICSHKLYGPKGAGVLYVRDGTKIHSLQTGGSQEANRRAGTNNVPLIIGLAAALDLVADLRQSDSLHFQTMRDRLIAGVLSSIPGAILTGHPTQRLANHASFVFPGVSGNHLVMNLDNAGFALSSGSACKTGDPAPSDVLLALGYPHATALGALRATVGRGSRMEDIDRLLAILPEVIATRRALEAG
jgi:cysteine desulfurase